jgi:hypothetical protein
VLLTDTTDDSPEAASRYLDDQLRQPNTLPPDQRSLTIDGHRAVRVYSEKPAAQPAGVPATSGTTAKPVDLLSFAVYVAVGRHVIGIEGTTRADADAAVVGAIKKIEGSLRVLDRRP